MYFKQSRFLFDAEDMLLSDQFALLQELTDRSFERTRTLIDFQLQLSKMAWEQSLTLAQYLFTKGNLRYSLATKPLRQAQALALGKPFGWPASPAPMQQAYALVPATADVIDDASPEAMNVFSLMQQAIDNANASYEQLALNSRQEAAELLEKNLRLAADEETDDGEDVDAPAGNTDTTE